MLPPLIDITTFRDGICADQLILTSNQRLAAQITKAWGQLMAGEKKVWKAPRVFSMDHWLRQCWDELQDQNHDLVEGLSILGNQQSRYYWDRAITEQDPELKGNYSKTAEKTLAMLQNWQLKVEQVPADTPAVSHFVRWASQFDALLKRNRLVTAAESWQLVSQGFVQQALPREETILLYGFQSIPPLQSAVLGNASTNVKHLRPHSENLGTETAARGTGTNSCAILSCSILSCADPQKELATAANWAAVALAGNPNQRIGLVIPDLNNQLSQCARVISEALQSQQSDVAVNISAGVALADTALVQAALELLGLFRYSRPLQEWLDLLYSPYSMLAQLPVQSRVDIELALRKTRRFDFTLDQFIYALSDSDSDSEIDSLENEGMQAILQPLLELQQKQRQQSGGLKSFADWAGFFDEFLHSMGWPGKRSLNSVEYQQRQQWKNLLEQLSELDNLNFEVGIATAIKHLQQLAQDKVFHPQTGDAPLQVLGLLEASGLRFDQLWIVDMTSQNFPASVAINPMLPADFQRQHQMPHALPQRELEIANELLQGFQANANNLILSYPEQRGEEILEPSPLLRNLPILSPDSLPTSSTDHPVWLYQENALEILQDLGPAFKPSNEKIRGGASLLKNQSLCPFNAFAIHRLWAESLEEPSHGMSAADRGSLLHEVMFRLWGNWENSTTLQSLSEQQIDEQLSEAIAGALDQYGKSHPVLQGVHYRQLEQQRLEKLIGQWLEEEKQRQPFDVVAREQLASIKFGDLEITMRLDRVDKIGDKLLVVDYKTGMVTPGNWMGERPKDPQLPLYVLASDPEANGCAFAQIKGGKIKFAGHSDSQLIPEEKPLNDWPGQVNQWRDALSNLANEFASGNAAVEVYDQGGFRYQDDLLPLNRWSEQADIQAALDSNSPVYVAPKYSSVTPSSESDL
ncbi:MAG: Uncharacterised protein [SAR92 bacterium MED-G29]|jgi:probable DNA repair protein|nr:MAG: Uncharacterised protein [SAR92 bacterium MED-G29]|tara:strand:+ start:1409 stop:4171 length:2763 start_codon:yes stop_codon:yes gene_type:complete